MRIIVYGMGIIGASVAAALRLAGHTVLGKNRGRDALEYALSHGMIDGIAEDYAGADVVVLALPASRHDARAGRGGLPRRMYRCGHLRRERGARKNRLFPSAQMAVRRHASHGGQGDVRRALGDICALSWGELCHHDVRGDRLCRARRRARTCVRPRSGAHSRVRSSASRSDDRAHVAACARRGECLCHQSACGRIARDLRAEVFRICRALRPWTRRCGRSSFASIPPVSFRRSTVSRSGCRRFGKRSRRATRKRFERSCARGRRATRNFLRELTDNRSKMPSIHLQKTFFVL